MRSISMVVITNSLKSSRALHDRNGDVACLVMVKRNIRGATCDMISIHGLCI